MKVISLSRRLYSQKLFGAANRSPPFCSGTLHNPTARMIFSLELSRLPWRGYWIIFLTVTGPCVHVILLTCLVVCTFVLALEEQASPTTSPSWSHCAFSKAKKVSLVANQHRAVDSTIEKIVDMFRRDGTRKIVTRTDDHRTDKAATLAVAEGTPLGAFRTLSASRWKPNLILAHWVAWILDQNGVTPPLTLEHGLRERPEVLELKDAIRISSTHPDESTRVAAEDTIPYNVRQVCDMLLCEAAVVGSTAYGSLYQHTKKFTEGLSDVLVVEETGAITEAEVLVCIFRQKRYIMSFDHRQLPLTLTPQNSLWLRNSLSL